MEEYTKKEDYKTGFIVALIICCVMLIMFTTSRIVIYKMQNKIIQLTDQTTELNKGLNGVQQMLEAKDKRIVELEKELTKSK